MMWCLLVLFFIAGTTLAQGNGIMCDGGFELQNGCWYNPENNVGFLMSDAYLLHGFYGAWLGGVDIPSTESLVQDITIPLQTNPSKSVFLQLYLRVFFSNTTLNNYFRVAIDNTILFTVTAQNYSTYSGYYIPVTLDISSFADGSEHYVTLLSNSFDYRISRDYSNFWVDDVSVIYRPTALYERDVYASPTGNDATGDGTQGNPFRTIQTAVWAVSNNFTVHVSAGNYIGEIDTCGKGIKIEASGTVILFGQFVCSTVASKFTQGYGGNLVIDGFSFLDSQPDLGGGLAVGWGTVASIWNSIFWQTTANYGGAVIVQELGLLNSQYCVYHQTSSVSGLGAAMVLFGRLTSNGDTFSDISTDGSVFFISAGNLLAFNDATFINNECNSILNIGINSQVTILNSLFDANQGNLIFANQTTLAVANTIFSYNTATNANPVDVDYALVYLASGTNSFINCTFSDNEVENSYVVVGAGADADDELGVTFSHSRFYRNTATQYIFAQIRFAIEFEDSSMVNNSGIDIMSIESYVFVNRSKFAGSEGDSLIRIVNSELAQIDNSEFSNAPKIAVSTIENVFLLVTNTTFTNVRGVLVSENGAFSSFSNCNVTSSTDTAFVNLNLSPVFLDNILFTKNTASNLVSTINATIHITNTTCFGNLIEKDLFSIISGSQIYLANINFIQNEANTLLYVFSSRAVASNVTAFDHPLARAVYVLSGVGSFDNFHLANCRTGIESFNSPVNISNSLFENFRTDATYDGVVILSSALTYVENCTFQNNARAIIFGFRCDIKFNNGKATNNFASLLFRASNSNISISHSAFIDNQLGQTMMQLGTQVVGIINSTIFENNFSLLGPSVAIIEGEGHFTNCTFTRNNALLDVGSVAVRGRGYFTNCTIAEPIGGVAMVYFGAHAIFTDCSIDLDTIFHSHKLGPILVQDSTLEIVNSRLFDGTDAAEAGIIAIDAILLIRDSTFTNNAFSSSIILGNGATLYAERSTFTSNNGASGSVFYSTGASDASFDSCTFVGNSAMATMSNPWKTTRRDSTGGVFCMFGGNLTVTSSSFSNNYCASNGGVLWTFGNTTYAKFTSTSFSNNTAGLGGAISWLGVDTPNITYEGCTFTNNSAVYGEVSASQPIQMSVDFPDTINSGVTFPLSVSVTDTLSQVVETSLPLFSVIVQQNDTGEVVLSQEANGNLGQLTFALNLTGNVGAEYDVLVRSLQDPVLFNGSFQLYSLKIQSCVPGSVLNENNACVPCRAGTAQWAGTCQECPSSAVCPGGVGIFAQQGWWVPPVVDITQHPKITVFPCDPSICHFNSCRSDNVGVLCGECNPGYAKMRIYCNKCGGAEGAKVFFYLIFCLLCAFTLSYYVLPSTHMFFSLFYVLNTIAVLGQFNPDFAIIPLVQFNVDFWPKGCIGDINFGDKFFIATLIILVFVLPISLTNVVNFILRKISSKFAPKEESANFVQKLISNLLTLYPPLCFFAFHMFSHVEVNNINYLSIDPSVRSTSTIYKAALAFAIIYTVIGFGLLLAILLLHKRTILEPLTAKYKDQYKFWDAIVLLRIIAVTTFFASFPSHPQIRTIIVALLLCAFTFLHAFAKPFEDAARNHAETIAQSCACVCALLVNSHIITARSPITVGILLTIIGFATFAIYPLAKMFSRRKVVL